MELLPNILVVDSVGATETGMNGIKIAEKGEKSARRSGDGAAVARLDRRRRRPQPASSPARGRSDGVARTGNIPLGYYKDPERSAQTFIEVRRHAVRDPRRLRDGRGRRSGDAARPRLDRDQHRRREGLPRRGRGRAQVPPRRLRRARGRCARRAVGRAGHRGRAGTRGHARRRSRTSTRTAGRRSRRTRRRSRCSSSTRSAGRRAASPTTRGPRSTRRAPPTAS